MKRSSKHTILTAWLGLWMWCSNAPSSAQELHVYKHRGGGEVVRVSPDASGDLKLVRVIQGVHRQYRPVPPRSDVSIPYQKQILSCVQTHGLPAAFVLGVMQAESNFNPRVVSYAGAVGLMQLMPQTSKWLGVRDAYDPAQNIAGGCALLAYLRGKFRGDVARMVAAYNAGAARVEKKGMVSVGVQNYTQRVFRLWRRWDRKLGTHTATPRLALPARPTRPIADVRAALRGARRIETNATPTTPRQASPGGVR